MKIKLIIIFFILIQSGFTAPKERHFGILTDDFGIVTTADLKEEEAKAIPVPFSHNSRAYQYWQCFHPESYELSCENIGDARGEGYDVGDPTMWFKFNGKKHSYVTRHNNEIEYCNDMIGTFKKILKKEQTICISGHFVEETKEEMLWVIDRFKTKSGEWSWFERDPRKIPKQMKKHKF